MIMALQDCADGQTRQARIVWIDRNNRHAERTKLRRMFEARKRLFVDQLGLDLTLLDGRFEIDELDDARARYAVLYDSERDHLASVRLLASTGPTVLGSRHRSLCEAPLPSSEHAYEVSRFCLGADLVALERRLCRNRLLHAIAAYCVEHAIFDLAVVALDQWIKLMLRSKFDVVRLGTPDVIKGHKIGAMRIAITRERAA
jgi:N-acyl-L-homoserine lactone synthetase